MKYPLATAEAVAADLVARLTPHCERIIVAGSIRRRRPMVGDVEIVYVPKFGTARLPGDLFSQAGVELVAHALNGMRIDGTIVQRLSVKGTPAWGEKNKLAVHTASGIPVDFFRASENNWFNYLVCRTGGAENNKRIAMAAQAKGWMWNPYEEGFSSRDFRHYHRCTSEESVFEFVGLPYLAPEARP